MSRCKLTLKARSDLVEILLYTTDAWGEAQAERYLSLLSDSFDLIAENPGMGRACNPLVAGLRRFEVGKHVVFYKQSRSSVVVSRILHKSRLPKQPHFMEA